MKTLDRELLELFEFASLNYHYFIIHRILNDSFELEFCLVLPFQFESLNNSNWSLNKHLQLNLLIIVIIKLCKLKNILIKYSSMKLRDLTYRIRLVFKSVDKYDIEKE